MLLEAEMAEDNPEGHEGSGGLDQEGGAQQTVPLPLPGDHEGGEADEGHENVMGQDEGAFTAEPEDFRLRIRDLLLVFGAEDHVHGDAVVQKVEDAKDEVVVKDGKPFFKNIFATAPVYS